jgi:hypothetical protein
MDEASRKHQNREASGWLGRQEHRPRPGMAVSVAAKIIECVEDFPDGAIRRQACLRQAYEEYLRCINNLSPAGGYCMGMAVPAIMPKILRTRSARPTKRTRKVHEGSFDV